MKKQILLIIIIFNSLHLFSQNYKDTLDIKLKEFHSKKALSGFAVSIVNMDGIIYQNSLGFSNIKNKLPYTQNTVQCIASVSKTTIAYAVMKLQEEGKLSLESPINDFLPFKVVNSHYKDSIIRIKHLVTHTSGIIDTENNYDLRVSYFTKDTDLKNSGLDQESLDWFTLIKDNKKISLKKYCNNVFSEKGKWYNKSTFNKHPFASQFEYTNVGAVLMAYIVERVSGKCYTKYIEANVFKALKMENTTFDERKVDSKFLAKSYVTENLIETPSLGNNTYPDGGIHTNSKELSAYLIEMIKGYNGKSNLLSEHSFKQMMSPILSKEVVDSSEYGKNFANIGVFWHIAPNGNIWHNGGNPLGGAVYMWFDPKTNIGRILITNCDIRASKKTIREFLSIWYTVEKYADKYK